MPNGPISASGLNRNPRNITIYSSGYDTAPSLTSNHFSIFEMASRLFDQLKKKECPEYRFAKVVLPEWIEMIESLYRTFFGRMKDCDANRNELIEIIQAFF